MHLPTHLLTHRSKKEKETDRGQTPAFIYCFFFISFSTVGWWELNIINATCAHSDDTDNYSCWPNILNFGEAEMRRKPSSQLRILPFTMTAFLFRFSLTGIFFFQYLY